MDNSKLNYPPNFQGQLFKSVTIRQLFLRHGFLIKLLFVVWEREGGGGGMVGKEEWEWGKRWERVGRGLVLGTVEVVYLPHSG